MTSDLFAIILAGYLKTHCQGRAHARTEAQIAGDFRRLGMEIKTRDVQDAIAALACRGWPIGTTSGKPCGAFVCLDRHDFRAAYRTLYKRMIVQGKRCRRFKATAREALNRQRHFDFAEAQEKYEDLEHAPLLAVAERVERD